MRKNFCRHCIHQSKSRCLESVRTPGVSPAHGKVSNADTFSTKVQTTTRIDAHTEADRTSNYEIAQAGLIIPPSRYL